MRRVALFFPGLLFLGAAIALAAEVPTNHMCPVMLGNKVDPEIFAEYQGRKVYFCCPACKAAFINNPEKYLPNLPQFAAAQTGDKHVEGNGHVHSEDGAFTIASLIKPLGGLTLTLLVLTACTGLFMRKKPRPLMKAHKILAAVTLAAALVHALLVALLH